MASRFAKAAGGNWSSANTWSATSSAGVDNAGAPTAADDAIFDTGAIVAVVVDTTTCLAKSLTCQGVLNSITFTAGQKLTITNANNITFFAGMTLSGTGTLQFGGTMTLAMGGVTFPGGITIASSGTYTLTSNLNITGTLTMSASTPIFSGAFNISCGSFNNTQTFAAMTIPSGQSLTIVTSFFTTNNLNLKSGTASSSISLIYQGTAANFKCFAGVFTDVDASGSAQGLDNWYGGTLTRTVNITNRTSADIGGGGVGSVAVNKISISGGF